MPASSQQRPEPLGCFTTTHWSVVLQAREGDSPAATQALGQLCQTYWSPIYSYIRNRGYGPEDAEDLTQQFFARFLEKQHYKLARRERGRFRAFLLTTLKHFLTDEWHKKSAQKRGGGHSIVPLELVLSATGSAPPELCDEQTADRLYDHNWAVALFDQVRTRLASEYAAKMERFAQLLQFLPGATSSATYAQVAERLKIPEGTVKSDASRLKRRFAELLREAIACTVAGPEELEEEWRHLIAVLSSSRA